MSDFDFGRHTRLAQQAPAFEALTALEVMLPSLPPAYFTIHANSYSPVCVQCDTATDFEAWRTALQVPSNLVELRADVSGGWLIVETTFRGVGLRITGHGVAVTKEQAEPQPLGHGMQVVTLAEAVALMGALPMPTAGDLAEQRHLVDPQDHDFEHLADEKALPGFCPSCKESEATWCPDCACCRLGCYDGHVDNTCTHPNAVWTVTPVVLPAQRDHRATS